jgi:uncharacterized membrane protein YjgN (DUF898 family)
MITIQVELDSRRIGGIAIIIPYVDNILASTTCRQMLQGVLTDHLQQPDLLATAEKVSMFIIKQQDGCHTIVRNARQNATAKQQNWTLSMQGKWRVKKMPLLKMHHMLWLMWLHQTRVVAPGATLGLLAPSIAIYCSHDSFI